MTFGIPQQASDRRVCPQPLPSNEFANLWHGWDFIEAKSLPERGHPPWQRVKKFPLEPRSLMERWRDPEQLVGVSFGKETNYLLADIDLRSRYHPHFYPSAYRQLLELLEDIGLIEPVVITSSNSGGVHLYYPLPEAVSSFKLGHLLKHTCEQGGLSVKAGQLELFPNAKRYSTSSIVLYQAHRLPLQQGSYLLDDDLSAIGNSLNQFMIQWKQAAAKQDIALLKDHLDALSNVVPFPQQQLSNRAKSFKADDEAKIREGWTGPEQTNDLLGVIARYGRVWEGLADEELAQYIESVAVELPGYQEYCGHREEIAKRSLEWAISSTKHYYPYMDRGERGGKPKQPTNEEKQQAALLRIEQGMKELTEQGTLASGVTKRCEQLRKYGISNATLYKNKQLWHPAHYRENLPENPSDSPEQESTAEPQAEQGIEEIPVGISDPEQGSLGSSDDNSSVPQVHSEQTMGGCRGEKDDPEKSEIQEVSIDENEVNSDEKNSESLLEQVKAAAGESWSVTLERLVEAANPQRVLKVLETFWQQVKRVKIANVGAWLHRAIVEGYEPNPRLTASAEQSEFNEWFELAMETGLAIASESSTDGQIWVYLSDGRKGLWNGVKSQKSGVESSSLMSYLCQISEDESQVATLETGLQTSFPPSQAEVWGPSVPMPEDIRQWVSQQKAKRRRSILGF